MNRAPKLRVVDALTGNVASEAVSYCQEIKASSLPERMRQAADTLSEVSALFGYPKNDHAPWTADELRSEARVLDS